VNSKSFSRALYRKLVDNLPKARVDYYDSSERNEDSIDLLKPGVTVLNKRSVKGQEFNAVFVMELEAFIPCAEEVDRRVMYMLCSRARDDLFLVHGPNALTTEAAQSLPGPDLLERQ
jgi:superfamily I DNA/RNA helicase